MVRRAVEQVARARAWLRIDPQRGARELAAARAIVARAKDRLQREEDSRWATDWERDWNPAYGMFLGQVRRLAEVERELAALEGRHPVMG